MSNFKLVDTISGGLGITAGLSFIATVLREPITLYHVVLAVAGALIGVVVASWRRP